MPTRNLPLFLAIIFVALFSSNIHSQNKIVFLERTAAVGEKTYGYRVYLPPNFDQKKKYPVVLYLHGSSSRGKDNKLQVEDGLATVIRIGNRLSAPVYSSFIAVFPQCDDDNYWVGEMAAQAVKALDQTVAEFRADPKRLYLTGFSLGGYGTIYLAAKHPGKFAAIAPIGGDVKPEPLTVPMKFPPPIEALIPPDMLTLYESPDPYKAFADAIGGTPIWIFHGTEDNQVSVDDARRMAEALKAAGRQLKYTEYNGDRHFVFDKAYTEPGFWSWLLAQQRSGAVK